MNSELVRLADMISSTSKFLTVDERVSAVEQLLYEFGPPIDIGDAPYDEMERYLYERRHQAYVVEISEEEWEEGALNIRNRRRRERRAECEKTIIDNIGVFAITPEERTKLVQALMDTFKTWRNDDW